MPLVSLLVRGFPNFLPIPTLYKAGDVAVLLLLLTVIKSSSYWPRCMPYPGHEPDLPRIRLIETSPIHTTRANSMSREHSSV